MVDLVLKPTAMIPLRGEELQVQIYFGWMCLYESVHGDSPFVGGIGHTRDGDKRKVSVYVGLCLYHGVGVSNGMGLVVIRLASDQRASNDQRHVKPPSQMKQNHTALGRAE